jgi:LmbE family N-acetylglucosaminyl deacetylase
MPFPGLRRLSPIVLAFAMVAALAVDLALIPHASAAPGCPAGTAMNVVAHQDDDLLFQSPAIISAIHGGLCVRTVYVTAGDANDSVAYWASRENGVKAAYAQLAGVANAWTTADAGIAGHPIPVATLVGATKISLAFMRLPDGGLDGSGGSNYGFQSLQKLHGGVINTITAVNNSSSYTLPALQGTLLALMNSYEPNQIATLDFAGDYSDGDHSDHHTVAYFVLAAQQQYTLPHTITGYQGYDIAHRASNVFNPDLTTKTNAFLTYAQSDSKTCNTAAACSSRPEGAWFSRHYTVASPTPTPTPTPGTGTNVAPSATITASSQNTADGQTAVKAVDGAIDGYPGDYTREWATAGGNAGSHINLAFPSPVTLNRVVLYDRPNSDDQITAGTLAFSDGTTVTVPSLDNAGQATAINFTARSTTSLRLTVTNVSGTTVNVGLAEFQAYTNTTTASTVSVANATTAGQPLLATPRGRMARALPVAFLEGPAPRRRAPTSTSPPKRTLLRRRPAEV